MRTPLHFFAVSLLTIAGLTGLAGCNDKKGASSDSAKSAAATGASVTAASAEPEPAVDAVCKHVLELEAKELGKPTTAEAIKECIEQGKAKLAKGPEVKCILKCGMLATSFAEAKKCKDTCSAEPGQKQGVPPAESK